MREVNLSNDAKFEIGPSSYADASKLKAALLRQISEQGIKLPGNAKDIKELTKIKIDADLVVSLFSNVALLEASEEIFECVMACGKKCLYNGEKLTKDTLDNRDTWPVVVEIKIEIIKENVLPFFQNLLTIAKQQMSGKFLDTLLK